MTELSAEKLLTVIRQHCLECSGGSVRQAQACRVHSCQLYPYRTREAIGTGNRQKIKLKGQISAYDLLGVKA